MDRIDSKSQNGRSGENSCFGTQNLKRSYDTLVDEEQIGLPDPGSTTQVVAWRARWADPQCPVFIYLITDMESESVKEASLDLCAKIALMLDGLAIRLICPAIGDRQPETVVDDLFSKVRWVVNHAEKLGIDPGKVIIGGSGTGACLAAAISMNAVLTGAFQVLFHMMLSPIPDNARILEYEMDLLDKISPVKWRNMPELLMMQIGRDHAGSIVENYASRLSGFGVRVVTRRFIKNRQDYILIQRDAWEEAQKMMILNLLFAIRRAS